MIRFIYFGMIWQFYSKGFLNPHVTKDRKVYRKEQFENECSGYIFGAADNLLTGSTDKVVILLSSSRIRIAKKMPLFSFGLNIFNEKNR